MKRTMKKIGILALAFFAFAACNKEDQTGSMTFRMTDAPGDYLEVNVDIVKVGLKYEDDDFMYDLPTETGIYNLLELQNDVSVVIAEDEDIPVGDLQEIRLILGTHNSIVVEDEGTFDLFVPSAYTSGIKIKVKERVENNEVVDILLDFDAEKSIVKNGNGDYHLKPVIHIKELYTE